MAPLRSLPPLAWAAVLFLLSHQPAGALPAPWFPGQDKVAHVVLYAPLGAALGWALGAERWRLTLLLGVLYGVSDEWHQTLVPGRQASAGDVLADAIGVALGVLVLLRMARVLSTRPTRA